MSINVFFLRYLNFPQMAVHIYAQFVGKHLWDTSFIFGKHAQLLFLLIKVLMRISYPSTITLKSINQFLNQSINQSTNPSTHKWWSKAVHWVEVIVLCRGPCSGVWGVRPTFGSPCAIFSVSSACTGAITHQHPLKFSSLCFLSLMGKLHSQKKEIFGFVFV